MGFIIALFIGTLLFGVAGFVTILVLAGIVSLFGWIGLAVILLFGFIMIALMLPLMERSNKRWEQYMRDLAGQQPITGQETSGAPHDALR